MEPRYDTQTNYNMNMLGYGVKPSCFMGECTGKMDVHVFSNDSDKCVAAKDALVKSDRDLFSAVNNNANLFTQIIARNMNTTQQRKVQKHCEINTQFLSLI